MKPWDDLTEAGRFRRLRGLAINALDHYAVTPTRLSLVGGFTNVVYRVDTAAGPLALRVDYMQDHSDENVEVELAWLEALADTDLDVARVVAAEDGRTSVYASTDGVPGARRCVLFEWIPGKPLAEAISRERYFELGTISARLHAHGSTFEPPSRPMAWDRTFYWPEDVDPVVYHLPEHAHHFAGGRRATLERAIELVEPAFARIDEAENQIVHCDIHPWNVHVYYDRLIVLDFEDVAWAHPVQDVAVTLFYQQSRDDYGELRAAFRDGYETLAPWPETYLGEVDHFVMARTLMFVNLVLNLGEDPTEWFDHTFPRIEAFVKKYG